MKLLITFFSLFFIFSLHGQSYHVVYHKKKNYKSSGMSPAMERKIKKMFESTIRVYDLHVSNGRSVFKYRHTLVDGQVDNDPRRKEGNTVTYKDFAGGYYVATSDFYPDETAIREPFEAVIDPWTFVPGRDTVIAGFACKYAYTTNHCWNNTVYAWYAPSIPVMDGPYYYAGLPGLIMRMETNLESFEVAEIKAIENDQSAIEIPTRKKYMGLCEFVHSKQFIISAKKNLIKKKD